MARQLQFRRGNTTENVGFIGALGEVTVDTEKKQLRLHDGETPGGIVIGARDLVDLFDFKWSDHLLDDPQWVCADDFAWINKSDYFDAYQHLLDDYESTSTGETETIAGTTITYYTAVDGHKIVMPEQESNVEAIYVATGVAWYYILDTLNEKFKLPRTKFAFTGIRNGVGNYVEPGLPNITGVFNVNSPSSESATGAFQLDGSWNSHGWDGTASHAGRTYSFNASRSSSIYGNSETVQPPATQMYLYFSLYLNPYHNPSESAIVATSFKNQNVTYNPSQVLYNWSGTLQEYTTQQIAENHPDWLCFITDDTVAGDVTNIVHIRTPETITSTKTFTEPIILKNTADEINVTPSGVPQTQHIIYQDKNGDWVSRVEHSHNTDGTSTAALTVRKIDKSGSNSIAISVDTSGNYITSAPTPADATDNSTQIATTAHVINVLQAMYPVGSVYLSTTSTCPMATFFGTWTLVSSGKALWTGNGNNANTTINAGLPDITGSFTPWGYKNQLDPSGAFTQSETAVHAYASSDASAGSKISFKASNSNNIYGKSTTVQPPAYVVNVWRRTA